MFYEDYNSLWPAEVKEKYQALQALLIRKRFVENRLEICESYEEYSTLTKEAELGFNLADITSSKDARFGEASAK